MNNTDLKSGWSLKRGQSEKATTPSTTLMSCRQRIVRSKPLHRPLPLKIGDQLLAGLLDSSSLEIVDLLSPRKMESAAANLRHP
jgi:hypothetical protein